MTKEQWTDKGHGWCAFCRRKAYCSKQCSKKTSRLRKAWKNVKALAMLGGDRK